MVKIQVRTKQMREEKGVSGTLDRVELTRDINPDDIVAIESDDYEIESGFSLEMYDAYLDEIHPPVTIGYNEYDASRIMRELSPNDYQEGYGEWRELEEENTAGELALDEADEGGLIQGGAVDMADFWRSVLEQFPFPNFR